MNTQMKIVFLDDESFYNGIAGIVERGLTFEAHHNLLTIILTGGF